MPYTYIYFACIIRNESDFEWTHEDDEEINKTGKSELKLAAGTIDKANKKATFTFTRRFDISGHSDA